MKPVPKVTTADIDEAFCADRRGRQRRLNILMVQDMWREHLPWVQPITTGQAIRWLDIHNDNLERIEYGVSQAAKKRFPKQRNYLAYASGCMDRLKREDEAENMVVS